MGVIVQLVEERGFLHPETRALLVVAGFSDRVETVPLGGHGLG